MFKGFLTSSLILTMIATVASAQTTTCKPPTGHTAIYDVVGLEQIRNNLSGKYYLCNNIVLPPDFAPLTTPALAARNMSYTVNDFSALDLGAFNGIFNGGGKTISGLVMNRPNDMFVGLFRKIGAKGVVTGVVFSTPSVTANGHFGVVAGISEGSIKGVRVSSPKVAPGAESGMYGWGEKIGGIVGFLDKNGIITSSSVTGGSVQGLAHVGGIAGMVTGAGRIEGGISSSTVRGIYGANAAFSPSQVGGIAGEVFYLGYNPTNGPAALLKCRASGLVSARWAVGGVVGRIFGATMDRSSSAARVEGSDTVGALAGAVTNGRILNSYAGLTQVTIVKASYNEFIGALVGYAGNSSIAYTYSAARFVFPTGFNPSSLSYLGGIAGFAGDYDHYTQMGYSRGAGIYRSYYDKSKNPSLIQYDSSLGSPRTSAELMKLDTFKDFDISLNTSTALTIWKIKEGLTTPYLR